MDQLTPKQRQILVMCLAKVYEREIQILEKLEREFRHSQIPAIQSDIRQRSAFVHDLVNLRARFEEVVPAARRRGRPKTASGS